MSNSNTFVKGVSNQERLNNRSDEVRRGLQQTFDTGRMHGAQRGRELFGGGQNLHNITGQVIQGQQAMANGIQDPAFAALRARMNQGIQARLGQNLSSLQSAQAGSGVTGPAAVAQQQRAMQQAQMAQGVAARDLAIQDVAMRERGLQSLSNTLNRERLGQMNAELGFGGMASQFASQGLQQALGERNAGVLPAGTSDTTLSHSVGQVVEPLAPGQVALPGGPVPLY